MNDIKVSFRQTRKFKTDTRTGGQADRQTRGCKEEIKTQIENNDDEGQLLCADVFVDNKFKWLLLVLILKVEFIKDTWTLNEKKSLFLFA